jgi:hypothetical protein
MSVSQVGQIIQVFYHDDSAAVIVDQIGMEEFRKEERPFVVTIMQRQTVDCHKIIMETKIQLMSNKAQNRRNIYSMRKKSNQIRRHNVPRSMESRPIN